MRLRFREARFSIANHNLRRHKSAYLRSYLRVSPLANAQARAIPKQRENVRQRTSSAKRAGQSRALSSLVSQRRSSTNRKIRIRFAVGRPYGADLINCARGRARARARTRHRGRAKRYYPGDELPRYFTCRFFGGRDKPHHLIIIPRGSASVVCVKKRHLIAAAFKHFRRQPRTA